MSRPDARRLPNYILVTGSAIKRPILMANWGENGALLSARP
jgi:hypothetical protein